MSDTSAASLRSRPWWAAYLVLYGLTWLLGLLFGDHATKDIVLSIFFGVGIAGLWGYIKELRIGARTFWIAYFIVTMAFAGYALTKILINPDLRAWGELWVLVAIAITLVFPQWTAIWRYAFRSPRVWTATRVA